LRVSYGMTTASVSIALEVFQTLRRAGVGTA
jgi:hypothetical protein